MKDFLSWLGTEGGSPAEVALRERVRKLLAEANGSPIAKSRQPMVNGLELERPTKGSKPIQRSLG